MALIARGKTKAEVINKVEESVAMIIRWMSMRGLELSIPKTQIVCMTGRRRTGDWSFDLNGIVVHPTEQVKYLGVWFHKSRIFRYHVFKIKEKIDKVVSGLMRLMNGVNGPTSSKKRLLATVVDSVIMYAAPAWREVLEESKHRGTLEASRRLVALRIPQAYRTVSLEAILVISGMVPVELLAEMRAKSYYGCSKEQARNEMMELWQKR